VTYPVLEVAWARYAGHFIYMLLFFLPQRGIRILACSRPALQLLRSTLLCISTVIFVTGLPYVPLATASAISLTRTGLRLRSEPKLTGGLRACSKL
jgi:drug/metabolite transporter (DMT)-like permease